MSQHPLTGCGKRDRGSVSGRFLKKMGCAYGRKVTWKPPPASQQPLQLFRCAESRCVPGLMCSYVIL